MEETENYRKYIETFEENNLCKENKLHDFMILKKIKKKMKNTISAPENLQKIIHKKEN